MPPGTPSAMQACSCPLDDLEAVAGRVAEGEHRRRPRPAQHVARIDAVRAELSVDCIGIRRSQPDAGLDTGGQAPLRPEERARRCGVGRGHFDPASSATHWHVESLLEAERVDVEGHRLLLVDDRNPHRPNISDPSRAARVVHHCSSSAGHAYINDPGVVSVSPVSIHVLRPERIIGQPPKSCEFASSRSWSWVTVRRHESPTGSISQVTRVVPSRCTSSPQSARAVCTNRLGGSTSTFSPSISTPPARGFVTWYADPGAHVDSTRLPN